MSLSIENGDGFINIRNDIGTVMFKDNGVFETAKCVGWIDDSNGRMTVFKRNEVYTVVFLRSTLYSSTTDSKIIFNFKNGYNNSGTKQSIWCSIGNEYAKIPFKVKSIRCTVLQQNISSASGTTLPDIRASAPEAGGNLQYFNVLHDNEEILNGSMTTDPTVKLSSSAASLMETTTQDTLTFIMRNDGYGTLAYEFTMDFIYDN